MLLASISMIRSSRSAKNSSSQNENLKDSPTVSNFALILSGVGVGSLAGFVGAGGGFLIVPALVNIGRLDMKQAIGTSLFVIALQCLLGVLGDFQTLAQMNLHLFVIVALLAIVGMSIGTKFRQRVSAAKLKLGFGIFVLIMGTLILFQELGRGST